MTSEKEILRRLRAICLALPEAMEVTTFHDHPTFQIRKRTFAVYENHPEAHDTRIISVKATLEKQSELVRRPGFVRCKFGGRHGWTYIDVDRPIDWDEVQTLVHESHALVAPRSKKTRAKITPRPTPSRGRACVRSRARS